MKVSFGLCCCVRSYVVRACSFAERVATRNGGVGLVQDKSLRFGNVDEADLAG